METAPRKTIFLLGIAGTGMRGLAHLLAQQGSRISGTDAQFDDAPELIREEDFNTYRLMKEIDAGVLLAESDLLIYSDAVPETHPLRQQAESKHIPSLPYQEALGEFSRGFKTIAITGTHGKSSTTAFLAHILIAAGLDPAVLVGAPMPGFPGKHARFGKGNYFVVEADEYRQHFLALHPTHAIITAIDFDHPDYFASMQEVEEAYESFLQRVKKSGVVITQTDVQSTHPDLTWPKQTRLPSAEHIAQAPAPLPGQHMRRNAALAIAMAEELGVAREKAVAALASFPGLSRRFEVVGTLGDMTLISDYGHHPAEIAATLTAAREKYADKKIAAVFEAHMPERLDAFFDEFIEALSIADLVLVYPPFVPAGRSVKSADLAAKLLEGFHAANVPAEIIRTPQDLPSALNQIKKDYDVALAFTAGTLDREVRKVVQ